MNRKFSRRDFLKVTGLGLGALAFKPYYNDRYMERLLSPKRLPQFPNSDIIGRVVDDTDVRSRPDNNPVLNNSVGIAGADTLLPWGREVIGNVVGLTNQKYLETAQGYIWSSRVQPTRNLPNTPITAVPAGQPGFWAEVTVPYVDIIQSQPLASTIYKERQQKGLPPRIYYSMLVWVDDMKTSQDGKLLYRINERYGNPGDIYWVPAEVMRPLTADEVSPINPDVEEKHVVVNLTRQTLACYEGKNEVYFCRISSGAKYDAQGNAVDKWSTPLGDHPISRKLVSLHMSGETTGDWPAVAWTQIFAPGGVAIHSTYWHNYFGVPRSHGCVNAAPDDAKWVWRWTYPNVGLEPGDIDVSNKWPPVGARVEVGE